jgi:hypothetical protein
MPASRRRDVHDAHDAVLRFVEIVLAPLAPSDRAGWCKKYLPRSGPDLTRREVEEITGRNA